MKIIALSIKPGEKPERIEIDNALLPLQEYVGGSIECAYPFEERVALILNEEGKLLQLPINRPLRVNGKLYDVLVGNALLVSLNDENGEDNGDFYSLSEEQIRKYTEIFSEPVSTLESLQIATYLEREFNYDFGEHNYS